MPPGFDNKVINVGKDEGETSEPECGFSLPGKNQVRNRPAPNQNCGGKTNGKPWK
jgi:hypothetical protein